MAINAQGHGVAYVGDQDGVSVYQVKYAGMVVFEAGVRKDGQNFMVRRPGEEWSHTTLIVPLNEQGRVSGAVTHVLIYKNMTKILIDLFVIPALLVDQVPDGVPAEWKLADEDDK